MDTIEENLEDVLFLEDELFVIIAQIIMAVAFAFIGEPFCEWLQLVRYFKWNYLYSFVYYIILGIVVRAFILKCMMVSKRYYEKIWSPS